jgi:DNA modification methylase
MKCYRCNNWPCDCRDGIALIHGDCRDVLPLLPKVDLVLTDPPYGIDLQNHAMGKERANRDWTIAGDSDSTVGDFVCHWAATLPLIVFANPKRPWPGQWRQHLVWEKGEHVSGGGDPGLCWKPSWELIQVARNYPLRGRRDGAVIRLQAEKDDYKLHPSPKPVALMKYLIDKATHEGNVVLDACCGSGTTLIAAKQLNRRAIGIEIEERYVEIAANRLRQEVLQFQD